MEPIRMTSLTILQRTGVALAALAATASVHTSAFALDPALVPSVGADTGRFTLPISCGIKLGGVKVITIKGTVDIQGIAPVQLGPGQEFYLTQGRGELTLPAWLSTLGGLVVVKKADAQVDSLLIGATRSEPATINLATKYPQEFTLTDIPVVAGKPVVVGLPKSGDFLVGPYKAPADGRVQFRFEGASANVNLKSNLGVNLKVRAECVASEGNALLSVAVGPQVDASAPARYEGEPLNFPKAASGQVVGIVNAPYNCAINGKQYAVGIAVGGNFPLAVKRTSTLSFTNASGALTVPAATVNQMLDDGITSVQGRVDELRLVVEGGTPNSPNVLPTGTEIPLTRLERDKAIVLSLPTAGTVQAGPYKPDATAKFMVIGMGSAAATFQFNGNGQSVKATCPKPEPDALLVDAPIL
jgi:hypothetical protein